MANQPLAFAELLAGSVLVISAITDRSIGETIAGVTEPAEGAASIITGKHGASAVPGGTASTATATSPPPPGQLGSLSQTLGYLAGGGKGSGLTGVSGKGFTPGPGTDYTYGKEPEIAKRLNELGEYLKVKLVGISGYRTPAHSVAVGGFANDPHTRGEASDTEGAQSIPEAILKKFGLTRPFMGAKEANHIQLAGTG